METSARIAKEIRASRLQQLRQRCREQFRQAAFAARLAADQLEQIGPGHPTWKPLRGLQDQAVAQLERWNNRCWRLAKAEIDTLLRPAESLK